MSVTMNELQKSIRELGDQIRTAATQLATAAANPDTPMADLTTQQTALQGMNARLTALQAAYDAQYQGAAGTLPTVPTAQQAKPTLRDMLKSNEYAQAFAHAVQNGITPKRGRGVDECKVLFDAMTIGGGNPAGEDGGFLVPEDIDHQIHELNRTLNPLSELFAQETVSGNSGWRVLDTQPTSGMASVDEMGALVAGEQPAFSKVNYTLAKYGMFIPVSNELLSDEIANLFGYLARWFAKKCVITENTLLLAALGGLTTTAILPGEELKGIKGVLNKALDPAIAMNASILTNQTGYDVLDNLADANGRPMFNRDPQTGAPVTPNGRHIKMVADSVLANVGGKAPVYIGDFTQYATLFSRNPLEIVSTDIGGNAFRTDSIEVRGIKRMSVSKFDAAAVVLRTVTP
ncbi:MAG: phage major capsid protein [Clostridia bacterium]